MSVTGEVIIALLVILTVLGLVLGLIAWLFPIAARLIIAFTVFLMELPFILTLLVFILFPPTLIVFIVGYVLMFKVNTMPTLTRGFSRRNCNHSTLPLFVEANNSLTGLIFSGLDQKRSFSTEQNPKRTFMRGRFTCLLSDPQICIKPSHSSSIGLSRRFAVYC